MSSRPVWAMCWFVPGTWHLLQRQDWGHIRLTGLSKSLITVHSSISGPGSSLHPQPQNRLLCKALPVLNKQASRTQPNGPVPLDRCLLRQASPEMLRQVAGADCWLRKFSLL